MICLTLNIQKLGLKKLKESKQLNKIAQGLNLGLYGTKLHLNYIALKTTIAKGGIFTSIEFAFQ